MVGETISHYKIIDKLGQGGMGEVYLAKDTKLDRKVALKFLPESLHQDPLAEQRFLREAKSAAALDHPFVCKVYETGEDDGKAFISMEYVQGQELKKKLAEGPLPLKEALEIATEIAEALKTAHKENIVHRDLKPSNIMLTPDGHVKVMDFGLAKRTVSGETLTAGLTASGVAVGTLAYMSPEQLKGQNVDTRSDIFSFLGLSSRFPPTFEHRQGPFGGESWRKVSIVLLRGRHGEVSENRLDHAHLRTALREGDAVVATQILDLKPGHAGCLPRLVPVLVEVLEPSVCLLVPEDIGATW